jgi:hypothetical protein
MRGNNVGIPAGTSDACYFVTNGVVVVALDSCFAMAAMVGRGVVTEKMS